MVVLNVMCHGESSAHITYLICFSSFLLPSLLAFSGTLSIEIGRMNAVHPASLPNIHRDFNPGRSLVSSIACFIVPVLSLHCFLTSSSSPCFCILCAPFLQTLRTVIGRVASSTTPGLSPDRSIDSSLDRSLDRSIGISMWTG